MLTRFDKANPQRSVTADASGKWGCGAFEGIQFKWPTTMAASHISIREMIPIVMSAALWGKDWRGKSVQFLSDNSAVVALINSGSSRENSLMHLMRCFAIFMAKFNFVAVAAHIRGVDNHLADALSRNNRAYFLSHYTQAQPLPTRVPPELVEHITAGLDLTNLDQAVEFYFRSALAPSSQRLQHNKTTTNYKKCCTTFQLSPLPVSEHQLCQFCSLTHSTIKGYLSAIRHLQIASGFPDPCISSMAKLDGVVKGIKATRARSNHPARTRLPITPTILRRISSVWEAQGLLQDHVMLWAASIVCFFGFLRAGELTIPSDNAFDPTTHLTVEDITIDDIANPSMLKLHLKASKTDPFRKGVDVVVGRTSDKLCPVAATLAYLALRGNSPGFLFKFRDGRP